MFNPFFLFIAEIDSRLLYLALRLICRSSCLSQQTGAVSVELETMVTAKFKVEKFTGSNDFGLWRLKKRALLVHQGLEEALKGTGGLPADMSEPKKKL